MSSVWELELYCDEELSAEQLLDPDVLMSAPGSGERVTQHHCQEQGLGPQPALRKSPTLSSTEQLEPAVICDNPLPLGNPYNDF